MFAQAYLSNHAHDLCNFPNSFVHSALNVQPVGAIPTYDITQVGITFDCRYGCTMGKQSWTELTLASYVDFMALRFSIQPWCMKSQLLHFYLYIYKCIQGK